MYLSYTEMERMWEEFQKVEICPVWHIFYLFQTFSTANENRGSWTLLLLTQLTLQKIEGTTILEAPDWFNSYSIYHFCCIEMNSKLSFNWRWNANEKTWLLIYLLFVSTFPRCHEKYFSKLILNNKWYVRINE